jgi:phosphatidylglycerophosphatase A
MPVAPGTFGTVLGMIWSFALILSGSWIVFVLGIVAGFFLSVWLCGEGERILGQRDPGSIVLDEITAMPLGFAAWLGMFVHHHHAFPNAADLYRSSNWIWMLGIFVVFRLFDIVKPWPVRGSQSLPGGWGVTVDDFLAAGYVNLVVGGVAMLPHRV